MAVILSNVIPLLIIIFFLADGWRKGALYMLLSLIRLIVVFFLSRLFSTIIANFLITVPFVQERISSLALSQQDLLNRLPGISLLLSSNTLLTATENIAWGLLYGIVFAVIFFALIILFSQILRLSKLVNHVFLIGWINQFIGAVEGLIFGVFFTLVLIYIVAYLFNIFGHPSTGTVILNSWLPVLFQSFFS